MVWSVVMSFSLSGVGSTFASAVDAGKLSSLRASSDIDKIDELHFNEIGGPSQLG